MSPRPASQHRSPQRNFAVLPRLLVCFAALALTATSCSSSGQQSGSSEPQIIVTMDIWADIVQNLACDQPASITALIPSGASLHGFEASLKDRTEVGAASLLVANGLDLEEGLEATIQSAEQDGVAALFLGDELSSVANYPRMSQNHDPHIWLDPSVVIDALPLIEAALVDQAGLDAQETRDCAQRYRDELLELNDAIDQTLADVPDQRRKLVTNHDSLGYFADRYDLEVIGTVLPSTSSLAQASPASLERLAELIAESQIPVIFSESEHPNSDAQVLANRLGVRIIPLRTASLGPPGSGQDTYLTWMLATAELIGQSLLLENP